MAQDDRFGLARLERLEQRLQALEDAEAIRNLKARYAALCDAQYDADGLRCCSGVGVSLSGTHVAGE